MLVVPAWAKVNLGLEVLARRADGFHEIATVIVPLDWSDLVGVTLTPATAEGAVRLSVTGPGAASIPAGRENLAHRAAIALASLSPRPLDIDVWLDKRVPDQAGLGGGSADAAAVLRAGERLLDHLGAACRPGAVPALAAELGSDVPALLDGASALATGRGDLLTRLQTPRLDVAVAVLARVPTAGAYAALAVEEFSDGGRVRHVAAGLHDGGPSDEGWGSALEAPAVRAVPVLGDALARLRAATPGSRWHLTGSGGAAIALAAGRDACVSLVQAARRCGFAARACRTVAPA